MNRDNILEKLRRVDDRLSIEFGVELSDNVGIVIVGGAAIALAAVGNSRKTKDRKDLLSPEFLRSMNWEALEAAIKEAWLSRMASDPKFDPGYQQMMRNYKQFLSMAGR